MDVFRKGGEEVLAIFVVGDRLLGIFVCGVDYRSMKFATRCDLRLAVASLQSRRMLTRPLRMPKIRCFILRGYFFGSQ